MQSLSQRLIRSLQVDATALDFRVESMAKLAAELGRIDNGEALFVALQELTQLVAFLAEKKSSPAAAAKLMHVLVNCYPRLVTLASEEAEALDVEGLGEQIRGEQKKLAASRGLRSALKPASSGSVGFRARSLHR